MTKSQHAISILLLVGAVIVVYRLARIFYKAEKIETKKDSFSGLGEVIFHLILLIVLTLGFGMSAYGRGLGNWIDTTLGLGIDPLTSPDKNAYTWDPVKRELDIVVDPPNDYQWAVRFEGSKQGMYPGGPVYVPPEIKTVYVYLVRMKDRATSPLLTVSTKAP